MSKPVISYLAPLFAMIAIQGCAGGSQNDSSEIVTYEDYLKGPDRNLNGIRDDLEIIVQNRYKNQAEKAAATMVLKSIRDGLSRSEDPSENKYAGREINKRLNCFYSIIGEDRSLSESIYLRNLMINNDDRKKAWESLFYSNLEIANPIPKNAVCKA